VSDVTTWERFIRLEWTPFETGLGIIALMWLTLALAVVFL